MLARRKIGGNTTKAFWGQRYAEPEYAYGTRPNAFLLEQANRLRPGMRALALGEGEGRNAVWLAQQGLAVRAADQSANGLAKASQLAVQARLSLDMECADLTEWQ